MNITHGVFAPMTTPFDSATGDIDASALVVNSRALLATDLAGLVLFGTTGEGLLLEDEERTRALEIVRREAGGRSLLAAVTAESTRGTVRKVKLVAAGSADGVLVAPPSYYRPQMTTDALVAHYTAVADASPVPVLLYQVPRAYSGIELRAELVAQLSHHPNIAGIKDSAGDLQLLAELVTQCDPGFSVLVGSGGIFYGGLEVGATGGILGVADIAPALCCELLRRWRDGDEESAGAIQEVLTGLHKGIVASLGVPGVKAALDHLGLVGGSPRAPLRPLGSADRDAVRRLLAEAGLLRAAEPARAAGPFDS